MRWGTELSRALDRELKRHPGASYRVTPTRGNHLKITLKVGEAEQFVVASASPSDHRSIRNCIGTVRRVVRNLQPPNSA